MTRRFSSEFSFPAESFAPLLAPKPWETPGAKE